LYIVHCTFCKYVSEWVQRLHGDGLFLAYFPSWWRGESGGGVHSFPWIWATFRFRNRIYKLLLLGRTDFPPFYNIVHFLCLQTVLQETLLILAQKQREAIDARKNHHRRNVLMQYVVYILLHSLTITYSFKTAIVKKNNLCNILARRENIRREHVKKERSPAKFSSWVAQWEYCFSI
jgi:hypothetical protein